MKKWILAFLMCALLAPPVSAQTFYSWRYREHATDCTSLTDGKDKDLCFEIDANTFYKCEPSIGNCDTTGEWKLIVDTSKLASTAIDTYSELNTIVADQTLTHNGLINTFAELDAIVADQTLVHSGSNVATATALAANGSNCTAGSYPLGVDASGAVESCTAAPTQASLSVDDLITLSGVAEGAANLGTFTGTTITDSSTIKAAMQELETAVEAGTGYTNLTSFVDQTAWRVFYSDVNGDVTELALGADGTFLKSNGASLAPSFATPAGSGDVSKSGTPADNQVGVWTGDGTIEGTNSLWFDGTNVGIGTTNPLAMLSVGVGDPGTAGANDVYFKTDLEVDGVIYADGGVTGAVTGNASTATALAANGGNCSAGSYPLGVDASGAAESCTDATTEIDSAISTHAAVTATHGATGAVVGTTNTQTLTNKTLTVPVITLEQGTAPAQTAEGRMQWDTDDNRIVVGDGATTQTFYAGDHTTDTNTNASTECTGTTTYYDGEGNCDDISSVYQAADADLTTYAGITPSANAQTLLGQTFAQMQASLSVDDLITLSGVAEGSTSLGTFTGATITDSSTIKTALQELETKAETAASDTTSGIVELATAAETTTGTDTGRAITPDGLAGSDYGKRPVTIWVLDDSEDTAVADGSGDVLYRIPAVLNGYNLVGIACYVQTAGTTGTTDIQVHNVTQAADMLTTKCTVDSAETDSSTAATAAVIDTANDDVATGDKIRIDVDAVATTAAKGLGVELTFQLP